MNIEIENTSSPGASFTANTNQVLLKTYQWITANNGLVISFKDFRMKLQDEMHINDNNNRNIYPLLKNGGLVNYEKGENLYVEHFFTNTGLAYVKTIEAEEILLQNEAYSLSQKEAAKMKLEEIRAEIICKALKKILQLNDLNYVEPLKDMIHFLIKFEKINKTEFAYLIYARQTNAISEALSQMENGIDSYRINELEINVDVKVRNDIELRKKVNSDKRKEGLTFLTSYGYFTSLLLQAGLIQKDDGYFIVSSSKRNILQELVG